MRNNEVTRALAAEWFKILRQRMAIVLPVLVAVLVVLMYFVAEFAAHRDWIGVPGGYFVAASVFNLNLPLPRCLISPVR